MRQTWVASLRASARLRWRNFRSRSKFYQLKALIAFVYAALVVLTIGILVPKPQGILRAYVIASKGDFVLGPYVLVRNDSSDEWKEVVLLLNGSHEFRAPIVRPGDKVTVVLPKFRAPSGAAALSEREVRELVIRTSRTEERFALSFTDAGENR